MFIIKQFFLPCTLALYVCTFSLVPKFSSAAFEVLNDWEPNYTPSDFNESEDGNWTLASNNLSVIQTTNAPSSYLLTPVDKINLEVNGTVMVSGNTDNDYVGLYFGYQDPSNYYHFKWSRSEAEENGTSPLDGWKLLKLENGATTLLNHGYNDSTQGWEMGVEHNFSLIYTEGNMTLRIQGDNNFNNSPILFSHEGNFSSGKFGFWTGSQQDANFSNILITDLDPPVLSILGDFNLTHEATTPYLDANATANDTEDGNLTSLIEVVNGVNENVPGIYYVTYTVKDSSDIERNATRTVNIVDTTRPVISLNGDANVTHEAGDVYLDANASWSDTVDGNGDLNATGNVEISIPGVYTLFYNRTDVAGNSAFEVNRTVNVVDTTPPIITLNGDANVTHEAGTIYQDMNASWTDEVDNSGTINFTGTIDGNTTGQYILSYNYTDAAGNIALEVNRTVNVVDNTPPVVQLIGASVITHEASTTYAEAGAVWSDFVDSNDSNSSLGLNMSGTVDYSVPGNYTLVYSYTDGAGNEGNATRTIEVVDTIPPVLTIHGDANYTLGVWQEFVDPGADANDSVDGNVTAFITTSQNIDRYNVGTYQVEYSVHDAAGNEANITRVVNVVNTAPTDLSLTSNSIYENMPVGSLVGSFYATDSDDPNQAKEYLYELLETNQTYHLSFYIDSQGDLRNSEVFDFELDVAPSLLVRVTDEFGGTFEKLLDLAILDATTPIIETTLLTSVNSDGAIELGVRLLDAGGDADLLEWGVLVSSASVDDMGSEGVQKLQLSYNSGTTSVTTPFVPGVMWDTVYVRAYAMNEEGTSYGLEEFTEYSEKYLSWADAFPMAGVAGWWESAWFGTLYTVDDSPWIMHVELGWIYPIASDDGSVWIWQDGWQWSWTNPSVYPFFYSTESGAWRYFFGKVGGSQVFYDYGENEWADIPQTDLP